MQSACRLFSVLTGVTPSLTQSTAEHREQRTACGLCHVQQYGGKRGPGALPSFPLPPSLIGCASLEPNFSRSRLHLRPRGSGVRRPRAGALGGSFRGRRQPRGASRADAAGAARSRRRLVNGTRTGAGADTAAFTLRQGPTARIPRPPSAAPEIAKLAASIQWVKKRPNGDVGSPDVMCSARRELPARARSA
ncbi:hypothetical protein R6Z07M_012928 [Ovis aries]